MKKRMVRAKERATELLELPAEVTLGLPKFIMVGNGRLTIENHRGIVEYTPLRARVATTIGLLIIEGKGLTVTDVGKEEILVLGEILSMTFVP